MGARQVSGEDGSAPEKQAPSRKMTTVIFRIVAGALLGIPTGGIAAYLANVVVIEILVRLYGPSQYELGFIIYVVSGPAVAVIGGICGGLFGAGRRRTALGILGCALLASVLLTITMSMMGR